MSNANSAVLYNCWLWQKMFCAIRTENNGLVFLCIPENSKICQWWSRSHCAICIVGVRNEAQEAGILFLEKTNQADTEYILSDFTFDQFVWLHYTIANQLFDVAATSFALVSCLAIKAILQPAPHIHLYPLIRQGLYFSLYLLSVAAIMLLILWTEQKDKEKDTWTF